MIEQEFNCTVLRAYVKLLKCCLYRDLFNKSPATILLLLVLVMGSVIHSKISTFFHHERTELIPLWKHFLNWADAQQSDRFLWMAFIILGHSIIFTPGTLAIIFFSGNHFFFWPVTICAMMACLVVNLAGLSTKITIPVFFISLIIDLVIIICTVTNSIDLSGAIAHSH
jgi:hypothetical protein